MSPVGCGQNAARPAMFPEPPQAIRGKGSPAMRGIKAGLGQKKKEANSFAANGHE
jgi:hypothetical protein